MNGNNVPELVCGRLEEVVEEVKPEDTVIEDDYI